MTVIDTPVAGHSAAEALAAAARAAEIRQKRITSALLYLDGVHVSFDGFHAINNLSLVLEPGEMRAIIGPNGAGTSPDDAAAVACSRRDADQWRSVPTMPRGSSSVTATNRPPSRNSQ